MVRDESSREVIIARLTDLMRFTSNYRLLMHQVIADRLHLSASDLKCLDLIRAEPEVTPGRLAEFTGLSTSAASAAVDRLERRGYVQRIRDDYDLRRVFVTSTGLHEKETSRVFAPLVAATTEILDDYTDEQLAVITDFLERLSIVNAELIDQHRNRPR